MLAFCGLDRCSVDANGRTNSVPGSLKILPAGEVTSFSIVCRKVPWLFTRRIFTSK